MSSRKAEAAEAPMAIFVVGLSTRRLVAVDAGLGACVVDVGDARGIVRRVKDDCLV